VCEDWKESFQSFYLWCQESGYEPGLSLDRIDNDDGYHPGNCRWVEPEEQNRNKRNTLRITLFGETKCAREWLRDPRTQVSHGTFWGRLSAGWDPETALSQRPKQYRPRRSQKENALF
jgi:hypothetical protein